MYVRQHYKLATTGKLGQKLEGGMGAGHKSSTHGMKSKTMTRVGSRMSYAGKGVTPP